MKIIDFHSHILPNIDDGSDSVETSLLMIDAMLNQGVDTVVATPHFYAHKDRIETFLQKRQNAFEALKKSLPNESLNIVVGAEVAYFSGISKAQEITDLTIDKAEVLLLEMPFQVWNEEIIGEVRHLIYSRKLTVMIAHLDRYLEIKGNKPFIKKLLSLPVVIQLNAGEFLDRKGKRKLLKIIKQQDKVVLGSDCHNMNTRPPILAKARAVLGNECDRTVLQKIDETGENILGGNKNV